MGGEDFSYMLEARPGAFIFIGNGDTAGLHHPAYDFNDAAIAYGVELLGAAGGEVDGVATTRSEARYKNLLPLWEKVPFGSAKGRMRGA